MPVYAKRNADHLRSFGRRRGRFAGRRPSLGWRSLHYDVIRPFQVLQDPARQNFDGEVPGGVGGLSTAIEAETILDAVE